ncbi:hypothetical protein [Actinomadura yumaensis]|uniref:Uncharacterized protein n=1 Tax=Actinomadura yumaensis TaxID=111807 RepID=A0ABW2CNK5_9ACTN
MLLCETVFTIVCFICPETAERRYRGRELQARAVADLRDAGWRVTKHPLCPQHAPPGAQPAPRRPRRKPPPSRGRASLRVQPSGRSRWSTVEASSHRDDPGTQRAALARILARLGVQPGAREALITVLLDGGTFVFEGDTYRLHRY